MHLSRTELKRSLSYALACLLLAACGGAGVQHSAAPPDPELLPEGAVAFRYHRGHLYFDATVCDSIPARLVFDTGATGIYVDSLWLARSGVAPGRAARGMIGGTGVSVASMRILLEKLAFAIDTLRRESEMTPVLALKEVLGRQSDGIFGQRFLAQSCVEFNLRRGYMRAVSPDTLAAAGFACVAVEKRDDRIYLPACVRFDAGHAAEGLRPGDVVVEWDGEPVGGMRIDSAVTAPGRHRMAALRGGVRTEYTIETKEIL